MTKFTFGMLYTPNIRLDLNSQVAIAVAEAEEIHSGRRQGSMMGSKVVVVVVVATAASNIRSPPPGDFI